MQKIIFSLIISFGVLTLNAQNVVHDANAQVRNVSEFNKIRVSNAISLYLSQGNEQGVAVSSENPNITNRIITQVSNGTLKIYVENGAWNGWNWKNIHLKAYVTFTTLESLDVSGACAVELTDPIHVNNFKMELSGASSIKGQIKADDMDVELTGASTAKLSINANSFTLSQSGASNYKGDLTTPSADFDISGASVTDVNGTVSKLSVDASGASNFRGDDLTSENCKVEATGASSANINVSKDIQATASGASNIRYSGSATLSNVDVSSGSTVKKKS
ncbi:MAG: DUF2807 domain-containing protein [Bacteroidetes bacterium]|nr:DUF2807 domain-containing protein [Bacteroidota bacterium]